MHTKRAAAKRHVDHPDDLAGHFAGIGVGGFQAGQSLEGPLDDAPSTMLLSAALPEWAK